MTSNSLPSEDVLRLIEEKRKQALELRQRKLAEQAKANLVVNNVAHKQQTTLTSQQQTVSSANKTTTLARPCNFNSGVSQPNTQRNEYFTQIKKPFASTSTTSTTSPRKRPFDAIVPQNQQRTLPLPKTIQTEASKKPSDERKVVTMSVVLQDTNTFSVTFDYESDIIKIFRSVDSKKWDPVTKKWSFSLNDFIDIFAKINQLKHLKVKLTDSIPESVIHTLIEANKQKDKQIDLTDHLEADFVESLYNFQRTGIIFGIRHEGRCLIADDMGLGKTIQAIGLAKWYQEDWPLLIVCPSSLRFQWMNALLRWVKDLTERDICMVQNTKQTIDKVPVTITSYDLMARMKNRFTIDGNRFYNMIIMDESHYIKSDMAQRTSTALLIAKSCKRVVLLSGTPALSKPIELFPQLNILNSNLFPSKHAFGLRYCDAKQKSFFRNGKPVHAWDYNGSKNLDELRIILENTVMIRRLKKEVLDQLPRKKREMVCLTTDHLNEKEKKQLNNYRNELIVAKRKDRPGIAFTWFTKSATAKVSAVNEYLLELLQERDIKMIVFCHHKSMMDGIEEMLNNARINHIRIDGSTPAKVRQEACDVFQEKAKFKVALLSLTACGTGLNLTAASLVIFTETYWNPGVLTQAEDRAHRIGQQSSVRVIYLVAKGTIDEFIWPLISKKLEILNKAGLSRDNFDDTANPLNNEDQMLIDEFVNALDKDDFKSLF